MKRNLGLVAFLIGAAFYFQTVNAQVVQVNATGFVTDTLSGKQGANALHADAAKRNVQAGMAMYAVYDEATEKLYVLQPQGTGEAYVGQRLTVSGTLAPSAMQHAGQGVDPQSGQAVNFHHVGQDSSTPIGGVLTISSIAVANPGPPANAPGTQ
ncbi:MAG: hypothetical protein WB997_08470 [Candidatus Acidiferrales bacterium]